MHNTIPQKRKISNLIIIFSLVTILILVIVYLFKLSYMKNDKEFKLEDGMIVDENIRQFKSTDIGGQTWMVNDLDVSYFRNGDRILIANSLEEFDEYGKKQLPAMFIHNNMCSYNWFAVNDSRGLAPVGWRVAALSDWDNLLSKIEYRYSDLRSKTGWPKGQNGTDTYGFNAKPDEVNDYCGFWWTTTEIEMIDPKAPKIYANCAVISADGDYGCFISNPFKTMSLRVRCIKD
jgi:uncharacterized protein (TIGR02145 family)